MMQHVVMEDAVVSNIDVFVSDVFFQLLQDLEVVIPCNLCFWRSNVLVNQDASAVKESDQHLFHCQFLLMNLLGSDFLLSDPMLALLFQFWIKIIDQTLITCYCISQERKSFSSAICSRLT